MPSQSAPVRACALHERALQLRAGGEPRKARRAAKGALALFEEGDGPDHPDVANVLLALAGAEHDLGRYRIALALARRSLGILERTRSRSLDFRRLRVQVLIAVGFELVALGDYEAARPPIERALRLAERALVPEDISGALNVLAMTGKYTARYDEAERLYRRALTLIERRPGSERSVASLLHNIGGLNHARGRFARAEPTQRRGLALRERLLGSNHPDVASDVAALAAILHGAGKYGEARKLYKRALRIFTQALGADHFEIGFNLGNLAALCHVEGKVSEAARLYTHAIRIKRRALGPHHPDLAITLANFAALRQLQNRPAEARELLAEAIGIFRVTVGFDHPAVQGCLRI